MVSPSCVPSYCPQYKVMICLPPTHSDKCSCCSHLNLIKAFYRCALSVTHGVPCIDVSSPGIMMVSLEALYLSKDTKRGYLNCFWHRQDKELIFIHGRWFLLTASIIIHHVHVCCLLLLALYSMHSICLCL